MSGIGMKNPPKPRPAFRVGVVGHRLDRLPADKLGGLQVTIHRILNEVRIAVRVPEKKDFADNYTDEPTVLRAVSPLAEGTDRVFADEALKLGYELCCPMPFYQEEFEKDFTSKDSLEPNSLDHFQGILETARKGAGLTKFELDGDRAHAQEAYAAAGRVVLNQSDLLVVVWDGGEARGVGGTVDTLHEALSYHVPVLCIDALHPEQCRLMRTRADLTAAQDHLSDTLIAERHLSEVLSSIVHREMRLPIAEQGVVAPGAERGLPGWIAGFMAPLIWRESNRTTLGVRNYFAEEIPDAKSGRGWKLFRNWMGGGPWALPDLSIDDFAAQVRKEWPTAADGGVRPSPVTDWINHRLRDAFGWADGLADHYANMHRSAFLGSYLFAAGAVGVALLPVLLPAEALESDLGRVGEILFGLVEFFLLRQVLKLQMKSRRLYHEHWTDYRLLAELIRELRFMVPLGGGRPLPRIPPHLEVYGDPAQTWMYWYVRAIARQTGIPDARVTPDYIGDCIDFLDHVVGDEDDGQRGFHLRAERRARKLDEHLRLFASSLFKASIVIVLLRLILLGASFEWMLSAFWAWFGRFFLFLAGVFPALGAAFEGINNQGEFIRVAKRSAAMAGGLRRFAIRIAALRKRPSPRLEDVIPLSGNIAEIMVAEVVDWRAVFIDRR